MYFSVFAVGDHLNRIVWCDVICCAFFVASMLCIGMTSIWSWERGEGELCFTDIDGEGMFVEYMYSYVYTLLYIS